MQKRVLAIHDISCVGKCSLTVALPVLSAAGLECSVLPTAVLSTHTGGFTGYTFRDLTEDMRPIADHWKSLGLRVDAVYTGYLGSFRQLEIVKGIIDAFSGPDTLVLVDPVMADAGRLYASFDMAFAKGMAGLCARADVIVPNLTEAAFLLGEDYVPAGYDRAYIEGLLRRLSDLGPGRVVLSGVSLEKGRVGAASYDRASGAFGLCAGPEIEGFYHGTGDLFASALLAALLRGRTLEEAIRIAVDFSVDSISRTHDAGTDVRFGVQFEPALPAFIRSLEG